MPVTDMVEIFPGYSVSKDEYELRFGKVDLAYIRSRLKPEVFKVFIMGMGAIPGVKGLPDRSIEEYEHGDAQEDK